MEQCCIDCTLKKGLETYPKDADPALVARYQDRLREIVKEVSSKSTGSAPEISSRLERLREELFQMEAVDYQKVKRYFNQLMLEQEERLEGEILKSPDSLRLALAYACTGNYVDFSALPKVDPQTLFSLLEEAKQMEIPLETLEALREDVRKAGRCVYITDNCGEIVLDKLLIKEFLRRNPGLAITVLVRGEPVANDATLEDADQVGLTGLVRCMGNGTWMNGTVMDQISQEAKEALQGADFIISKGQANLETLGGCGLNVYYAILCKCHHFTEWFGVPLLTGKLARERFLTQEREKNMGKVISQGAEGTKGSERAIPGKEDENK